MLRPVARRMLLRTLIAGVGVAESVEMDGIVFDYDSERHIVSIEILDVSTRISRSPLEKIDFAVTTVE